MAAKQTDSTIINSLDLTSDSDATRAEKGPANPQPAGPLGDFGPAPDGGTRAWLVAAGAGFAFFSTLGLMNSFGVFQAYYQENQLKNETPDKIAWIGSIAACLQFILGGLTGPIFDRIGVKVIQVGTVFYVLSIMLTSLGTKYWHFMLTQGVLGGISASLIQVPSFALVSQYFDRKRAAALGIVVSGSSIGGIVFPIILSNLLDGSSVSFAWSVRILGFIVIPFLLFFCVVVRARLPPRESQFFIGKAWTEPKFVLLVLSIFLILIGMMTPLFFLPSYAVSRGMDVKLASYLLAIVNGASTFGRIVPGILADKFGRLNIFGIGALSTGIVIMCMNTAKNTAGLVLYSIFFGLTSGTIISGQSAALSTCTDKPQNLGTYIGMGVAVGSLATLIGPPVNGVLLDKYGGYSQAAIFSGVMCIAGGVVVMMTKLTTPQGLFGRV
ncbi:riboflavin transporter MCH5 [Cladorrhinum sp. PSN332]|nr:riboflavin transporter MCH5 [Cladorrhinum sp. PSN332]